MAIKEKKPVAAYRCTQAELYAGTKLGWESEGIYETNFADENTKYTPGLSVTRIAEIIAAKLLPDGQARTAAAEVFRIHMVEQLDDCLGVFNSLEGYIRKGYRAVNEVKPRLEEAGKEYYDKAYAQNWEELSQLLSSGNTFITNYNAKLTNDGGMPPTFPANFLSKKNAFDTIYGQFKDAEQNAIKQTAAKIKANNHIYHLCIAMMEDGKHIFRKDEAVRERFIWEKVMELITPPRYNNDEPIPPEPPVE